MERFKEEKRSVVSLMNPGEFLWVFLVGLAVFALGVVAWGLFTGNAVPGLFGKVFDFAENAPLAAVILALTYYILVFALYFVFVVVPRIRKFNLKEIKNSLGGEVLDKEKTGKNPALGGESLFHAGYGHAVIWKGDYHGRGARIEEFYRSYGKSAIYYNLFRLMIPMNCDFDVGFDYLKRELKDLLRNPREVKDEHIKLETAGSGDLPSEYFERGGKNMKSLLGLMNEITGAAMIEARSDSISLKCFNLNVMSMDFHVSRVRAIFDFLEEIADNVNENCKTEGDDRR